MGHFREFFFLSELNLKLVFEIDFKIWLPYGDKNVPYLFVCDIIDILVSWSDRSIAYCHSRAGGIFVATFNGFSFPRTLLVGDVFLKRQLILSHHGVIF